MYISEIESFLRESFDKEGALFTIYSENSINEDILGRYASAVANESNVNGKEFGFILINKNKIDQTALENSLKALNENSNLIDIQQLKDIEIKNEICILLKISQAPTASPIDWRGHFWGITNLEVVPLKLNKIEKIREHFNLSDWSAEIIKDFDINNLNKNAVEFAKQKFKSKHLHLEKEVDAWSTNEFLNKLSLISQRGITKTALLLFGDYSASQYLFPADCRISWIMLDERGRETGYQHFELPFILQIDSILNKLNNAKYDFSTDTSYMPVETSKYEERIVREILLNAIVHNNYSLGFPIKIIERKNSITIRNSGAFNRQKLEDLLFNDEKDFPVKNKLLSATLEKLNLIDNINNGLRKSCELLKTKRFPLIDVSEHEASCEFKLWGKVLDKNYVEKLVNNKDLDLQTVYALDKVQKKITVSEMEYDLLRRKKLVTGNYPNLSIASKSLFKKADKQVLVEKKYYSTDDLKKLVMDYLNKNGEAGRQEIDDLLMNKLPKDIDRQKRRTKIKNLLFTMSRKDFTISNQGSATKPIWVLSKK